MLVNEIASIRWSPFGIDPIRQCLNIGSMRWILLTIDHHIEDRPGPGEPEGYRAGIHQFVVPIEADGIVVTSDHSSIPPPDAPTLQPGKARSRCMQPLSNPKAPKRPMRPRCRNIPIDTSSITRHKPVEIGPGLLIQDGRIGWFWMVCYSGAVPFFSHRPR